MTHTEGERLAVLETKLDDLAERVLDIQKDVKTLAESVSNYNHLKDEIDLLKKQSNLWKWLSPTLSGALGAVLTFLILSYLQHI